MGAIVQIINKGILVVVSTLVLMCSTVVWSQDSTSPQVSAQLAPPDGEKLVLHAHAKGNQIYSCSKTGDQYAWTLKKPQAELFDEQDRAIGHHFMGPTWELNDGSQVVGKVVAKFDSPDSIPWLLLSAASHSGNGALSRVTSIQRLNTKGGKAPATGCEASDEGSENRVSYTADYFFYAKP